MLYFIILRWPTIKVLQGISDIFIETIGVDQMEREQKKNDFNIRDCRRIDLQHQAQFTPIREIRGLERCTIINISRNLKGMGIKFHTRENINLNSIITIDLLPTSELVPTCVTGIVRWIKQTEDEFLGGVELIGNTHKLQRILP